MDSQSRSDMVSAISVSVLLILTAWGNAVVMLVVAIAGLVAGAVVLRKQMVRGGALSAGLGFVLAIAIALTSLLA